MVNLLFTQGGVPIIGSIAKLLGYLMSFIYDGLAQIGINNMAICIVLFTFIMQLLMTPMKVKQQRFSKISSRIQPEIRAIQDKYKGKKDQASMLKMREEQKILNEKYGYSPMAGCLPMLLQMPVLFALYAVIRNIPAYVPSIKHIYETIGNKLVEMPEAMEIIRNSSTVISNKIEVPTTMTNKLIDAMYLLRGQDWSAIKELANIPSNIIDNINSIFSMNSIGFGIGISDIPMQIIRRDGIFTPIILLPIIVGISSFLSTRIMSASQAQTPEMAGGAASTMKTMNYVMPIMSLVLAVQFQVGLGIYWIANSLFMGLQQLIVNKYIDKQDVEQLIEKNIEKSKHKKKKSGIDSERVISNSSRNLRNIDKSKMKSTKNVDYTKGEVKKGSIADKARSVEKLDYK